MRGAGLMAAAGLGLTLAFAATAQPEGGQMRKMHMMPPPAFADIDSNKDGAISPAEFDAFHAAHKPMDGPPPGNMRHGGHPDMKSLDRNGDGKVSLEEFSAPMKAHFDRLDANHDGVLDASEWPRMAADQGPPPRPGN